MLNLCSEVLAWPTDLEPKQTKSGREQFVSWWVRHALRLRHLEPRIAEQWVHRHWGNSPYMFLDLDTLSWRLERWTAARIIQATYAQNESLDLRCDSATTALEGSSTSMPFEATGSWDYPIVLLETPVGIHAWNEDRPDVRYLLIEGHQRRRVLNAMTIRGRAALEHDVFLLSQNG